MKIRFSLYAVIALCAVLALFPNAAGAQGEPEVQVPQAETIYEISRPDAPRLFQWMSSHSLRLDNNRQPHIAYGGDHLYYAKRTGGSWQVEVVDDSIGVGLFASLALASDSTPHISYYDSIGMRLKYATKTASGWIIQVVDRAPAAQPQLGEPAEEDIDLSPDDASIQEADAVLQETPPVSRNGVGMYTSIALDTSGRPAISYYDGINGDLKYARWDGSSWNVRTLDPDENTGLYTSLAIDQGNVAHISYYDATNGDLRYITGGGATWTVANVDNGGTGDVGRFTSIALDNDRRPHISYYNVTTQDLMYARWTGSAWNKAPVSTSSDVGMYSSISVLAGSPQRVYISHFNASGADLLYSLWNGSTWSTTTVLSNGETGRFTSAAADSNGVLHISYYDSTLGELRYANVQGGNIVSERVDSASDVGHHPSLEVDPAGNAHIVYHDDIRDDLRYARWTGTEWQVRIVDSGGQTGMFPSLVLDAGGNPHISYYDYTNDIVRYARWTGAGWEIRPATGTVGSRDDVNAGMATSIALDAAGNPWIAYFSGQNDDAKLARWTGSNWEVKDIETNGNVGRYITLVIDADGTGHAAYQHVAGANQRHLRYTRLNNQGAPAGSYIDIVTEGEAGYFNAIAVDASGNPHFATFADASDTLRYASLIGGSLSGAAITTGAWNPALMIGADGLPYISYYKNRALNLAVNSGGAWTNTVVDRMGDVGKTSAIATGQNGLPVIAYTDVTNGDLKYASTFTFEPTEFYWMPLIGK